MSHYNKYYFRVLLDSLDNLAHLGFRSSQKSNINKEVPPSFVLTSLKKVCKRENKKHARKREEKLSWGFTLFWLSSIMRKFCCVFYSMRVSYDKYLCSLV